MVPIWETPVQWSCQRNYTLVVTKLYTRRAFSVIVLSIIQITTLQDHLDMTLQCWRHAHIHWVVEGMHFADVVRTHLALYTQVCILFFDGQHDQSDLQCFSVHHSQRALFDFVLHQPEVERHWHSKLPAQILEKLPKIIEKSVNQFEFRFHL